jgi:CheY-like chemotaxis protein
MTKPLAVICYENLLLGSQLVNRLHDLGYRVNTVPELNSVVEQARRETPLVVLIDMAAKFAEACQVVAELRKLPATGHIPVIVIAPGRNKKIQEQARSAGATLVAGDAAVLDQLAHLLDHVLTLE